MSTTGNRASTEAQFGGGAARSAPDYPAREQERRPSAREERRRVSERLAEAAETAEAGRVPGMPNASPWQRSNAVWHRAGIDWGRAEPPADPRVRQAGTTTAPAQSPAAPPAPAPAPAPGSSSAPASVSRAASPPVSPPVSSSVSSPGPAAAPPAASPAAPSPVSRPPSPGGYPSAAPPVPARSPGAPEDAGPADEEPWGPPRRRRSLPAVPLRVVAIVVAVLVVLGGGAYALFGGGDGEPDRPATPAAVTADALFAGDPAATAGGRTHDLVAVAASDRTVVAVGSEQGGVYSRGQFFVSLDGGHAWSLAAVHAADGGDPPPGEYPQFLAGGTGAWAALGVTPAGTVPWTSRDGRSWTRQAPVAGVFAAGDRLSGLARTGSGFVAAGTATVRGGTQAVMWTSADGRTWTRLGADQLKPPPGGSVLRLSGVTSHGDTVLAHGTLRTTVTVTRKVKKKKRKVRQSRESEGFWRSADGGRTWAPVAVPQADGSSGDVVAMAATSTGFFAVRGASQRTGSKKHRRTIRYAVVFGSPDGQKWAPAGRLNTGGYLRVAMLRGDATGLTGLVSVAGGKTAVMTSADGRTWRRVGDVPAGHHVTGAALAPQGPVVTGRLDDGDAYLTVAGAGDVNLASVPGAVHTERTVDGIASDAGQTVAVGSTNGQAALWTSPDGSAWTRAKLPPTAGAGRQALADAVHGGQGWLAVGGGDRTLAVMSVDGRDWQAVPGGRVFAATGALASAAAASGGAYVVTGRQNDSAAAWYSTDLKNWTASGDAGNRDLAGAKGAPRWMSDVAAGPAGFVAVGGQTKNGTPQPALWTSPDGKRWALSPTPPALPQGATEGSLTKVVAHGNVLVATGGAGRYAFAAASSDGGRTWRPASLPGVVQDTAVTAATATPHGFVLSGTSGASGADVMLWTSADGTTWQVSRPHGRGLDGPGVQRLDGMSVVGNDLVAVGFTGDYRGDASTLWRRPLP